MLSRRYQPSAFSLIELLAVIAIVVLLLSILLPSLRQAKRHAKTAQCASNMRQLYIALGQAAADVHGEWAIRHFEWLAATAPRLPFGSPVYRCPEDDAMASTTGGSDLLALQVIHASGYWDPNYVPLVEGPRLKILNTYENGVRWGYEDGGDNDFDDCIIDVTTSNGWTVVKAIGVNTTADYNLVVLDDPPVVVMQSLSTKKGLTWSFFSGESSYAMNAGLTRDALRAPGRILLLDYEKTVAKVTGPLPEDDWELWWDPEQGAYSFARHAGKRINVMMTSGAVVGKTADQIDPEVLAIRNQYWNLPDEPETP